MSQHNILLFGDQIINPLPEIKKLYQEANNSTELRNFLKAAIDVLKTEASKLSFLGRDRLVNSETLLQLAELEEKSDRDYCDVNGSLLVAIAQLGELFIHVKSDKSILGTFNSPVYIAAICTGLLLAAAVVAATDPVQLVQISLEILACLLRLSVCIAERSRAIENTLSPWSYVVIGIPVADLQSILDGFHQSQKLPEYRCAYISVVAPGWVTLTGPPSILQKLFSYSEILDKSSKLPLRAHGAAHGPHLPQLDIERIIGSSSTFDLIIPNKSIIRRTDTCELYMQSNLRTLLHEMIEDIGQNLLRINSTVDALVANLPRRAHAKLTVLGPSNHTACLTAALRAKKIKISLQDLTNTTVATVQTLSGPEFEATKRPSDHQDDAVELGLISIWAKVLQIDNPAVIGATDNFFILGGDSIKAIKLTAALRATGISLNVTDIFNNPVLSQMAQIIAEKSGKVEEFVDTIPFALLKSRTTKSLLEDIALQFQIQRDNIEDVYPCTPLQEGLMTLSLQSRNKYIARLVYKLPEELDLVRFRAAWSTVIQTQGVWRTRIIQYEERILQVVVREELSWRTADNLDEYLMEDRANSMDFGLPLARLGIIQSGISNKTAYFVITAHHAIFDGWSLPLTLKFVSHAYDGINHASPRFNQFIAQLNQINTQNQNSFWSSYLADVGSIQFPSTGREPNLSYKTIKHFISWSKPLSEITASSMIRAAWGLVVGRYTGSQDVVFGTTLTGRNVTVPGIESIVGPTIATVPIRVRWKSDETISAFLQRLQNESTKMIPFEQAGLQNICQINNDTSSACKFSNLLVVQQAALDDFKTSKMFGQHQASYQDNSNFNSYILMIECSMDTNGFSVSANYDEGSLDEAQVEHIFEQFEHVLRQISTQPPKMKLGNVDLLSEANRAKLQQWNMKAPRAIEACAHEIIGKEARRHPDAEAVCSWDGSLTYYELDVLSSRLAARLIKLGVRREVMIPLCFDKSMWAVVAMLGTLKAGGVFVPMDPTTPVARMRIIYSTVKGHLVLGSNNNKARWSSITSNFFVVDKELWDDADSDISLPQLSAYDAAYVIFTSGSTGIPKGVVIEHTAFCSSAAAHTKAMWMNEQSRMLQFSSYSFDACIGEILSTLTIGACVCIPSEQDRINNLEGVINSLGVNVSFLVPSVARLLEPSNLPNILTLCMGGEVVPREDLERWSAVLQPINVYGPTETCVICAGDPFTPDNYTKSNIGRAAGCLFWVVDANDHNVLLPIGAEGELLIEGPGLARGYLNDAGKTATSFIEPPHWVPKSRPRYRLYKTGDLARFNSNGTVSIIGRKDSQVKLRGQRLELGEVETHIRRLLPQRSLAVEVVKNNETSSILTAFISFEHISPWIEGNHPHDYLGQMSQSTQDIITAVRQQLRRELPAYMVPEIFIPLHQMPSTVSGKTDRCMLRNLALNLSPEQHASLEYKERIVKPVVASHKALKMLDIWSKVLRLDKNTIADNDSFFELGGDSISAMRLVAAARAGGISLTVADIFKQPTLIRMSAAGTTMPTGTNPIADMQVEKSRRFQRFLNNRSVVDCILSHVNTKVADIEDIVECSPFQTFSLGLGHLKSRGFTNYATFEFESALDPLRLEQACQRLVDRHQILRTVFVAHHQRSLQVTLRSYPVQLHQITCIGSVKSYVESYIKLDRAESFKMGESFVRFVLMAGNKQACLLIRINHAQYDGISLPMLFKDLQAGYTNGKMSNTPNFSDYLHARADKVTPDAKRTWKTILEGSSMTYLCSNSKPEYGVDSDTLISKQIASVNLGAYNITFATILKTAWAIVLGQVMGKNDIVFGHLVSGRNIPLDGVEKVLGPCINIIPIRVRLQASILALLREVQTQQITVMPYETMGLGEITRDCTNWPQSTYFGTIVQHQNLDENISELSLDGVSGKYKGYDSPCNPANAWITSTPRDGQIEIAIDFCADVIPQAIAMDLLNRLCSTVQLIGTNVERQLPEHPTWNSIIQSIPTVMITHPKSEQVDILAIEEPSRSSYEIVQRVWQTFSGSLGKPTQPFPIDKSFRSVWDNLMAATQLAALYRKEGIQLDTEEILENPTIQDQAQLITRCLRDEA